MNIKWFQHSPSIGFALGLWGCDKDRSNPPDKLPAFIHRRPVL